MESRRQPITGEDLRVTEALIAGSYLQLKQELARVPGKALRSAGSTVTEHPLATAAAVAAGGILAYGFLGMLLPRGTARAARGPAGGRGSPGLGREILSAFLPLAAPHVVRYVGDCLLGSPRRKR